MKKDNWRFEALARGRIARQEMDKRIEVDKEDLIKVLLLLIANDHLSASKVALEERSKNREEAIKELLFMVSLTSEEAEELYWIGRDEE